MKRRTDTIRQIVDQLEAHDIEFGKRYRDSATGFEGEVKALYFYEHGCMRVSLRGTNKVTGEPVEPNFDAPDLVAVATDVKVPAGPRTGGPHGLAGPAPR